MLIAAAVLGLTAGCQTLAEKPPIPVPKAYQAAFAPCSPGDGASSLQLFQDGALQGSSELEWISKRNGEWQVRLSDPVGRTMLDLKRQDYEIKATGKLAARLPKLSVRPSGFLEADGTLLGVTGNELTCILGGRLPRTWLSLVKEQESAEGGATRFILADPVRVIALDFARNAEICAHIRWGRVLGFMLHEVVWCQRGPQRRETRLDTDQGYGLRLVKIDEGPSS